MKLGEINERIRKEKGAKSQHHPMLIMKVLDVQGLSDADRSSFAVITSKTPSRIISFQEFQRDKFTM